MHQISDMDSIGIVTHFDKNIDMLEDKEYMQTLLYILDRQQYVFFSQCLRLKTWLFRQS